MNRNTTLEPIDEKHVTRQLIVEEALQDSEVLVKAGVEFDFDEWQAFCKSCSDPDLTRLRHALDCGLAKRIKSWPTYEYTPGVGVGSCPTSLGVCRAYKPLWSCPSWLSEDDHFNNMKYLFLAAQRSIGLEARFKHFGWEIALISALRKQNCMAEYYGRTLSLYKRLLRANCLTNLDATSSGSSHSSRKASS